MTLAPAGEVIILKNQIKELGVKYLKGNLIIKLLLNKIRRINLVILLMMLIISCKTGLLVKEINKPITLFFDSMYNEAIVKYKDINVSNLNKEYFNEVKKMFFQERFDFLNENNLRQEEDFILIEQMSMVMFTYESYFIGKQKVLANVNGKVHKYKSLKDLIKEDNEIGKLILDIKKGNKPNYYPEDTLQGYDHFPLSKPLITIVKNGKVNDFYQSH